MKLYKIRGDSQVLPASVASFPFGKCCRKVGVDNLHENIMEDWRGDFSTAAAFFDYTDTDEAWIEGGEGGERPGMWCGVFIMLRRASLAENVHAFDSQRLACAAWRDDTV